MAGGESLLPKADQAIIDPVKLHGYLLSQSHPLGRFKARFFAALGFSAERWNELENALREQHLTAPATLVGTTKFGTKYEIRAILSGPSGRAALVSSIWIVVEPGDNPRFVTAYPAEET